VPKRAFIAWLEGAENGGDIPPGLRVVEGTGADRWRRRRE
jgi:hypothetical protein